MRFRSTDCRFAGNEQRPLIHVLPPRHRANSAPSAGVVKGALLSEAIVRVLFVLLVCLGISACGSDRRSVPVTTADQAADAAAACACSYELAITGAGMTVYCKPCL